MAVSKRRRKRPGFVHQAQPPFLVSHTSLFQHRSGQTKHAEIQIHPQHDFIQGRQLEAGPSHRASQIDDRSLHTAVDLQESLFKHGFDRPRLYIGGTGYTGVQITIVIECIGAYILALAVVGRFLAAAVAQKAFNAVVEIMACQNRQRIAADIASDVGDNDGNAVDDRVLAKACWIGAGQNRCLNVVIAPADDGLQSKGPLTGRGQAAARTNRFEPLKMAAANETTLLS